MKQSDNIANLTKSLITAQRAIQAGVTNNQTNEMYGSKYADLGAVVEAVKGPLLAAGIVVIQSPTLPDLQGNLCLTTRLLHETGEWMEDTFSMPLTFCDPQAYGTAVSYARRYAISAMLNLYQTDDDGNAASGKKLTTTGAGISDSAIVGAEGSVQSQAPEAIPAAVQKRLDSWLVTIKNADLARLETSRASAKSTFSGRAFELVDKAFGDRIAELRIAASQPG